MKQGVNKIVQGSLIAAVYAALTVAVAPISYGVMQIRISEALTILPVFTPAAVPGLFVGCLIANMVSPVGVIDIAIGSLATLIAAVCTYKLRDKKWLALIPPIIANGLMVGGMLYYVYGVDFSLSACVMWVSAGEALACYGLGYPISRVLEKHKNIFK